MEKNKHVELVQTSLPPAFAPDLTDLLADWLNLDVANGDACADTLKTYQGQIQSWLAWCGENNVHPGQATTEDVKAWRKALIAAGAKPSTISLKLTTIRRFYQSAVDRGLIDKNPAANVRAPRERRARREQMKYLSAGEAELLFRAIPTDGGIKALRDRAMIGLMALEGLRRVEIVRACVSDIEGSGQDMRLLIHGKGKDRFIYPREDTAQALADYLVARGPVVGDELGEPLFVQIRKGGHPEGRITRQGVNSVINHYLLKAGLKREGVSCHALRHTCGALLYQATRDIRAVQETLGHSSISTSAGYAHIVERGQARYTRQIPVELKR
ncbi:integrase/recombinase XerC/integrase/recombinase XerD [Geothermobacter ehrlichii]|uniref:Integrase/recombinase XerC/integrase/recombinase XerD n=1 Tax=Geothermobacter ehrlichii TaxID=213224 RepID=A0A5D3WKD6_9BACT|nr:tyrosine-type recombinase/integrase [Geothermobacter ehrlichii]TYO96763.1 integrase/recombinase XerC/integrase/recombinase XerD [Geothermobacter ehrlichii]